MNATTKISLLCIEYLGLLQPSGEALPLQPFQFPTPSLERKKHRLWDVNRTFETIDD